MMSWILTRMPCLGIGDGHRGGVDRGCRDRTCFYHADQSGKRGCVTLLGSYGWGNQIAVWSGR
jgi:hypothetical protein